MPLEGPSNQVPTPRTPSWIRRPWKREPAKAMHRAELCAAVGTCDPRAVLDGVALQGGVHHAQVVVAVVNGRPLKRTCIDVSLQWYRAQRGRDFAPVHHATDDWYQPTAEDIGASLLLHMRTTDSDGEPIVACAEFGPIVEDPTIRSHVENMIDAQAAFFTNIHIFPSRHNEISMEDTWSLLIDDKRVRLSCESSLIPPFEALYSAELHMAMASQRPTGFILAFDRDPPTQLHLKVDNTRTRDIIYLVFTAFKAQALRCQAHSDAVSAGHSPLLALRTVDSPKKESTVYSLPWHQKPMPVKSRKSMVPTSSGSSDEEDDVEDEAFMCSTLLQDVDALLLGHGQPTTPTRFDTAEDVALLQSKGYMDGKGDAAVPKIRDIGTIALEALGKIDTVLAFELSVMNDHMKHLEHDNELLKAENNTLKAKLLQQREDEADIYFYLHKKLDANYEVITQLEGEIESVKAEKAVVEDQYHTEMAVQSEQFSKERKDWAERMESAEGTLQALELFQERKAALEETLEKLQATLAQEKEAHRLQLIEIERRNVQEKERIKKEMLIKIKENKQARCPWEAGADRTMMENDQMISELQYQSKETEKLLAKYKAIEAEVAQLRLQLKLNKETEIEMAKRTHFYQKLIKKLNERVQADQIAAQNHQAQLNHEDSSKDNVNRANEAMIAILNDKTTQLEVQLRALSSELADARGQLDAARLEKNRFLSEQDDTLRFLSTAIHDISHQIAVAGAAKLAPKEWQAGDVIPARLDELAPTDIKKVLQMLFGKLHTYQAKVVQICAVKTDKTREALEKQFGVELPPITPPIGPRDQLDVLNELANRGDSMVTCANGRSHAKLCRAGRNIEGTRGSNRPQHPWE
ncbi:hypothetical protein ACHHYP_15466 [Achlya hypogyna]|uniref:Cilia- and flagella-associated protein 157 n=1 Tax=Achlya hypogyna TaxID=1202772 RepID=A0A1V9YAS3_ACHHY|nr:hypothetical protein ACHHYP_15466 [Achlya hypogyna]